MKICPQCDNPIEDSAQACPYCSYQFAIPKPKMTWPEEEKKKEKPAQTPVKKTPEQSTSTQPTKTTRESKAKTKKRGSVGKAIIIAVIVYILLKGYGAWSEGRLNIGNLLERDNDNYVQQSYEPSRAEESSAESSAESTVESTTENIEESVQESSAEVVEEAPAGYILPYSNSMYYTREDLVGLTKEELRIARNEIYARHGRTFNDANLQAYFDSQEWYTGTVAASDFSDSVFNEYEVYNKDLIVAYEKELQ